MKTIKLQLLLVLIACFFQNCTDSDFELKDQEYLLIDGDLNHPKTLSDINNANIYVQARSRFEKMIFLIDGNMQWDIQSGSEIDISENIFEYIILNYENIKEQITIGNILVYEDYLGNVQFKFNESRLKVIQTEKQKPEGVDLTETNERVAQAVDRLMDQFELGGPGGGAYQMSDFFDMNYSGFQGDGMGFVTYTLFGYIDSKRVKITILKHHNPVYDRITQVLPRRDGNNYYRRLLGPTGDALLTIWYIGE